MTAVRLFILLFTLALGLGPGRPGPASALAGDLLARLAADPADDPAHPAALSRIPAPGLAARPPTSGHGGDGRPAPSASEPPVRYAEPAARPASLTFRPAGWRSAPERPPYYPTAPPARSRTPSIV